MAFFPGVGAKEGVNGPKRRIISSEPRSEASTSRRGLTSARGREAGSSTGPRSRPPANRKSRANPFAQVVRKST